MRRTGENRNAGFSLYEHYISISKKKVSFTRGLRAQSIFKGKSCIRVSIDDIAFPTWLYLTANDMHLTVRVKQKNIFEEKHIG